MTGSPPAAGPSPIPSANPSPNPDSAPASGPPSGRPPRFRSVMLLAFGQVAGWSALFYTFPAQLARYEDAFAGQGPSPALGLSLCLAATALCAPTSGAWIDRGRAPWMMPAGALVGAAALAMLSRVENLWSFFALWALVGAASSFCLYEPCFALLTRARGMGARKAITAVTLVAGFATLVAFPTVSALDAAFGWRGATLGMAALAGLVSAPLLAFGARMAEAEAPTRPPGPRRRGPSFRAALRRPGAARVAVAFGGASICHGLIASNVLPLMTELGAAESVAIAAASAMGPMQVVSRIALTLAPSRWPAAALSCVTLSMMALAATALIFVAAGPWAAAGFVFLQGGAVGAMTILRPTTLVEAAGTEDFGAVSGAVAMVLMLGMAVAPALGAGLRALAGPEITLLAAACLPALGATLLVPLFRRK